MSAGEWLRERSADVPPALTAVLTATVGTDAVDGMNTMDLRDVLVQSAAHQLASVLRSEPMSRAQALDLLAADAFATYAFEAAADEPETLVDRANAAMQAFAAHVER